MFREFYLHCSLQEITAHGGRKKNFDQKKVARNICFVSFFCHVCSRKQHPMVVEKKNFIPTKKKNIDFYPAFILTHPKITIPNAAWLGERTTRYFQGSMATYIERRHPTVIYFLKIIHESCLHTTNAYVSCGYVIYLYSMNLFYTKHVCSLDCQTSFCITMFEAQSISVKDNERNMVIR